MTAGQITVDLQLHHRKDVSMKLPLILGFLMMLSSAGVHAQSPANQGFAVVVKPNSSYKSIGDLVRDGVGPSKGRLNCGIAQRAPNSAGAAACGALDQRTGMTNTLVPYKDYNGMLSDLLAGQVDIGIVPIGIAAGLATDGKVRVLVVSNVAGPSPIQGVPTLAEAGYK